MSIKIKKKTIHSTQFHSRLINDERASTLIEYGLIVGFAILSFIVIVGIITSVLDWSTSALADFFNFFHL
jgi:Flp pilus assembly pilin Flp